MKYTPELATEYQFLFLAAHLRGSWLSRIDASMETALAHRARYEAVALRCGDIPWVFIAAVHMRESTYNFTRHLHNGDSLRARTVRVPAGRPHGGTPPFTWEESAIDALRIKGLHAERDWSLARMLYRLEEFNGWGYRLYRSHPSPYLWSGTMHYERGKYVADGAYSPTAKDAQVGAVALIRRLAEAGHIALKTTTPQRTLSA